MGRISIEYEVAVEYLKDGKWHSRDKVLRRVIDAVPPGRAAQMAERLRLQQIQKPSRDGGDGLPKPRAKPRDMDGLILTGAKAIARGVLNNRMRFEVNEDRTMIRLVPDEVRRARVEPSYVDRGKRSWQQRLRDKGIDPTTHTSKAEYAAQRRAAMQAWTPEQWAEYHRENARKSWAARRNKKEAHASAQDLPGRGGPQRQVEPRTDHGVRQWGPDKREGGDHPRAEEDGDQGPRPQ